MANQKSLEVIDLGVNLINGISKATADGKIDIFDAINLGRILMGASGAVNDLSGALAEMATWSTAERDQVLGELKKIDLPDDKKELMIEKVLQVAVLLGEVVLPLLAKAP